MKGKIKLLMYSQLKIIYRNIKKNDYAKVYKTEDIPTIIGHLTK